MQKHATFPFGSVDCSFVRQLSADLRGCILENTEFDFEEEYNIQIP